MSVVCIYYQKDKLKDSGWRLNKHWLIEDVASGREAENQNRELEELQQWQLYDKFVYSKAADTTCSFKVISISRCFMYKHM